MNNPTSNEQFTLQELDFIRTEMYASMTNGAEHPLFERVYEKCKAVAKALKATPVETNGEHKTPSAHGTEEDVVKQLREKHLESLSEGFTSSVYGDALALIKRQRAALERIMRVSSGTSSTIAEKALKGYSGAG